MFIRIRIIFIAVMSLGMISFSALPAWIIMGINFVILFLLFKILVLVSCPKVLAEASTMRILAFLFIWPGMNAGEFLGSKKQMFIQNKEWLSAGLKLGIGLALIFWIFPMLYSHIPMAAGWVGMVGLIFTLHFGFIHFVSLFFRSQGMEAPVINNSPAKSSSLREFWSERWNLAYKSFSQQMVYKPLRKYFNPAMAVMVTFFISGIFHELMISLPAKSGYGLPTCYFLLQGLGVLFENSMGIKIGLGKGLTGWLYVMIFTAGPAYWLFHPPFVRNVMLPMMHSITGT